MTSKATEVTARADSPSDAPGTVRAPENPSSGPSHPLPERLRVLHVFNYLGLGGTELTALRVTANLDKERFANRICGLRGCDPQVLTLRCPEADIVSMPARKAGIRMQLLRLMNLFKACRPHLVHSRNWGTIEAIPAARLAGVPLVVHSEHGHEMETLAGLPKRRRLFRRAVYGMTDALFTVTRELQQFHARQAWISPSRIRIIPNGIDIQVFAPRPAARQLVLEKVGVPPTRFVVGSVGRLVQIKDHRTLLKSAELLIQRGVDAHVLIAGSGPELIGHRQYTQSSVALGGRVTFLGASDKVSEILNAMDVFVLPSISEGMSNTLLEAMACGLPVLATSVGGNPEVIGEERLEELFSPGDIHGLAQRLERLARNSDLRRRMGAAARQRAVSRFSVERMVKDYQDLYLELALRRGIISRSPA